VKRSKKSAGVDYRYFKLSFEGDAILTHAAIFLFLSCTGYVRVVLLVNCFPLNTC